MTPKLHLVKKVLCVYFYTCWYLKMKFEKQRNLYLISEKLHYKASLISYSFCRVLHPSKVRKYALLKGKSFQFFRQNHVHSNVQFHWHEQSTGSWMTYIISVPFPEQCRGTVRLRVPCSRQHLQNLKWLSILTLKIVADGHFPSQEATFIYE